MDLHRWAGMAVVALLVFRLLWGLWGGTYARFNHYMTTPSRIFLYFTGKLGSQAHTPPGIALAICMFAALGFQAGAGLFTTDDVFIEGPLVQFASDELVETATDLHHKVWWFIVALIATHLAAHAVYGIFLRSTIPLSMFTGRKPVHADSTEFSVWRAVVSLVAAIAVFWILLSYSR